MPHSTRQQKEFIISFIEGEEQAFDQLFRQYFGPLSWYAFQQVHHTQDAEDIVQDCFVKLWQDRVKLKLESIVSIKSYLYKAIYNRCVNYLAQKESPSSIGLPEHPAPDENVEDLVIKAETLRYLQQLVNTLPAQTQLVLRLSFLEEKSCREISAILGTSIKTVERQRLRAIQLLRKVIITT